MVSPPFPIVTLLTDFGLSDEYVGVIKGLLHKFCPGVQIIDISHTVDPQNSRKAAHLLTRAYPYFPPGTVHLIIVDPGVGSTRKIIAFKTSEQIFVGPDNGLFSMIFKKEEILAIHQVTARHLFLPAPSNTFHGRDIMAPIAARLAGGLPIEQVGPSISVGDCIELPTPQILRDPQQLTGEVTHIDRFGNLCTNISSEEIDVFSEGCGVEINIGPVSISSISRSYSSCNVGQPLALYDSQGLLEIAINCGRFAATHGIKEGEKITVKKNL
ncbi:SAM hydrolase/SAM-dependent halogenase family protein [Desulforhopalus singaporensis]|uniref:S-adenosyl-l-methionine hydroxide adenosyltransferase n=1 Tax=Desulforhopalus singaporensis TaxID=91360 RepID=A0A1H0NBL1_9BACT|nr:SAM-dependent chlorinase/fluorinase [Desulforhopalus singaporensis]SDO89805.1 hypothetical protein SAMN05660330_01326 [Desulforhopalus singaporensis]